MKHAGVAQQQSAAATHPAPRSEVSSPPPRSISPVTPGRMITAPTSIFSLWGLYDERRRCLGMIGAPGGNDADTVEANARRIVQAWNSYDHMVAFLGELAEDVTLQKDLRARARGLHARLGGGQ
jgi:hypothetical protein